MKTAVTIENLGKRYFIRQQKQAHYTLRETLVENMRGFVKYLRHPFASRKRACMEEFWALKDISFEVKQGERIGIIGHNGAGKSTLFKILSRITEPTTGQICIHGRIASLLEVGTGFHMELTGRENIFLNGSVLGMAHREIKKKFDEIVAFAEVEKFLDTPVKRYSSGMCVRLAFAVAAHLDPEILLIDEVLAVGDYEFQKKCLSKMEQVAAGGKTVLFVSHDMNAIMELCDKALLVDQGQLILEGSSKDVVSHYINTVNKSCYKKTYAETDAPIQIVENSFSTEQGEVNTLIPDSVDIHIHFVIKVAHDLKKGNIAFFLCKDGVNIFGAFDIDNNLPLHEFRPQGYAKETFVIPKYTLKPGKYGIVFSSSVHDGRPPFQHNIEGVSFEVYTTENTMLKSYHPKRSGLIRYIGNWHFH